jgi:hypothetical protein
VWHPDNHRLIYNCVGTTEARGVYVAPVDGSEPPRLLWRDDREGNFSTVRSAHPDGRHLLIDVTTPEGIVAMRVATGETGGPHRGEPLVPDRDRTNWAAFSPDGKWVSYHSDDAGRSELFISSFDTKNGSVGRPILVTSTATGRAGWFETKTAGVFDLLYSVSPWRGEKVTVRTTPRLSVSDPEPYRDFSKIRPGLIALERRTNGRFMGIQRDEEEAGTRRMDLILNFDLELEKIGGGSN